MPLLCNFSPIFCSSLKVVDPQFIQIRLVTCSSGNTLQSNAAQVSKIQKWDSCAIFSSLSGQSINSSFSTPVIVSKIRRDIADANYFISQATSPLKFLQEINVVKLNIYSVKKAKIFKIFSVRRLELTTN